MNTRSHGIALVFVAGCAVGGVSSQLAVPKANAQQAATLTKWEYHCVNEGGGIGEAASKLGREGWEMVTVDQSTWCFKRPKM